MNTLTILSIGIAGGLGTLARYGTGLLAAAVFGTSYPAGTYCVNIVGSFLFGLLLAGAVTDARWQVILLTGFLGGFTTFSSFAYENYHFLEQGRYLEFAFHCIGQNILGILAVLLGVFLISPRTAA